MKIFGKLFAKGLQKDIVNVVMKLSVQRIRRICLVWFYPIFFIICFIQARGWTSYYYPAEGVLMWPFRILMLLMGVYAFKQNCNKCKLLSWYIVYSLFTIVLYVFNEYPFSLYVNDLAFVIIPMLFAYVGLDKTDLSEDFYKYTLWSIVVTFMIGIYLYFVTPLWYQEALVRQQESKWWLQGISYDFDFLKDTFRFGSFLLTSYATEYFGVFAFPFSLSYVIKSSTKKKKFLYSVAAFVILLSIILSMQRAAIISCILTLLVFGIYDFSHGQRARNFYLFLLGVVMIFMIYYAASDLGSRIIERFTKIDISALSDRMYQSENLYGVWNNYIMGNGLGTGGGAARRMGYMAVTDANYTKILVELGFLGFGMFLAFIVSSCIRVVRFFKYFAPEGAVLASVLVCMIGSNALTFSMYIPPFWYCVGRIWNNDYLRKMILEKNHI